ncbi:hypothetical protein NMG60_11026571 [Bertholletia excelsa]
MLQRAASNACSWWWASHVRTKQTKWIEQSLQDMEEKVQIMLKLIEEDGDSFAKRAEMYYKRRPELINYVTEAFRAYKSLAERYDHISKELQNANNTIASVFPERVQFEMDDDDDYDTPRVPKNIPRAAPKNVPKVPKLPGRDLRNVITAASKKLKAEKSLKESKANKSAFKSGLSKEEALQEVDKLQKEILALQTVKEFVKSSYESGLFKYNEIENQIIEVQQRVSNLQDEFSVGKVIEDDEARTLMAEAALKSFEETLARLQQKQERSKEEANEEFKRVEEARQKLKSIKHKFIPNQQAEDEKDPQNLDSKAATLSKERQELDSLKEKIEEHFKLASNESLTVTDLAEKIDELANKVISLETAVSSQDALINRLKTETNDLQTQIRALEDDKVNLTGDANSLSNRLKEMEDKLNQLQDLHYNVENQDTNIQKHFIEAGCSLDFLSENLHSVKPDEDLEFKDSLEEEDEKYMQENVPLSGDDSVSTKELSEVGQKNGEPVQDMSINKQGVKEEKGNVLQSNNDDHAKSEVREEPKSIEKGDKTCPALATGNVINIESQGVETDEPNWQHLFTNGLDDREKILLAEYTTTLRNFKEVKQKLNEVEKKNRDSLLETTMQVTDLKSAISKRDEEIQSLRQKLNLLKQSYEENKDLKKDIQSIFTTLDVQNDESKEIKDSKAHGIPEAPVTQKEHKDVKLSSVDEPQSISPVEATLRRNIDAVLDENLDFWLRFCTSFQQIQKFKTGFLDLQAEISKLMEKCKSKEEGSVAAEMKSEIRPIYAQMREIQTELTLWIDKSTLLKDDLQQRFSSLCNIQEEVRKALEEVGEEEANKLTSHQAASFQGEVSNMKKENNKVKDELLAGLDGAITLQHDIEETLTKLNEEFQLSGQKKNDKPQLHHSASRSRIPLRSFIFGTKPKRKTIFSCMHHKKHLDLKSAFPL